MLIETSRKFKIEINNEIPVKTNKYCKRHHRDSYQMSNDFYNKVYYSCNCWDYITGIYEGFNAVFESNGLTYSNIQSIVIKSSIFKNITILSKDFVVIEEIL